ncbi:hypothetical protein Tco_0038721 [Tanacetum coccineum]
MAPNRSKSRYAIKECSTCGSWYTKECCSIGNLNDQIIIPVPDSSQHCAVCGTPVDGPYCHGCTLIRMKFEKDLFAYCVDNGVFQNFQDTSESSNDNTNVVNAPREPSVVDQDPGVNISQDPPQIDHNFFLWMYKFLNEIQPLKQETPNQIQKDQEEMRYLRERLLKERLQKANQALNESQSPQKNIQKEEIDIDYRRKCEDKIYELKDKFNGLSIEIRKIIQEAKELKESEARARIQKIIIDDDDDDLGFHAVHPNTIHTPVSQKVEPKDSLIMGDGHINTTPEMEAISVETLVSNPSYSDDFSLGECNLFDIDDSYYKKSKSRLAHLAPNLPKIVEVCVDDDDTDDDDDYDDDFYDCVDIEEDGGEIDLDISKIVDISLREKLVESYLLIEKINTFNLSPPIPISPTNYPSSTIPVVDLDLPLEEADVPSFSDDSMIFPEYESFTFDDEPVMAEVNVFDEINTSELSYPGIGENVVLDEEEDTFTFTTRSFLPFVTYPEVLPTSYSTGSEDKVFKPGIFDNVLKRKSSLTLDVFDPLHPPLMDFHVTKAFSGFTFSLLKIFSKKFFEPGIKNATVYLSYLVWGGFHLLEFLHPHYYPP